MVSLLTKGSDLVLALLQFVELGPGADELQLVLKGLYRLAYFEHCLEVLLYVVQGMPVAAAGALALKFAHVVESD